MSGGRKLEQRVERPPRVAAVVAAEEAARLAAGIDRAVGGGDREREDTPLRQLDVPHVSPASRVRLSPLAQAGEGGVGIGWVNGQALGAAALERDGDVPSAGLVQPGDRVAGGRPKSQNVKSSIPPLTFSSTPVRNPEVGAEERDCVRDVLRLRRSAAARFVGSSACSSPPKSTPRSR